MAIIIAATEANIDNAPLNAQHHGSSLFRFSTSKRLNPSGIIVPIRMATSPLSPMATKIFATIGQPRVLAKNILATKPERTNNTVKKKANL